MTTDFYCVQFAEPFRFLLTIFKDFVLVEEQAGAELCQAQANLKLSSLCWFDCVDFRPVALQIRTIPGG